MKDSLNVYYSTWISKQFAVRSAQLTVLCLISFAVLGTAKANDDKAKMPKAQHVDFEESAVNGQVRRPDGFLLSKKSDPTLSPLFNAKKNIEERIQKSHFILK